MRVPFDYSSTLLTASAQGKLLVAVFFFASLVLALSISNGFAQEEKKPAVTVTQEFFKASQRFERVDKNKNKILDDLEEKIRPATPEERFDVIVMAEKSVEEILPILESRHGDFSETFTYPSISGFATNLTKGQIIAFSQDADIKQVEFDAEVIPFLDKATFWFGVQKARTDFGKDGNMDGSASYSKNDIVIAVIDTGIDPNHLDLDGGKIIGWKDFATGKADPYDELGACAGHGTHVSSIAAGEGQANAAYKGVAPGAALVGVKVLKVLGVNCTGKVSTINAGVQWVIDNKATYGIEIFNMSIGIAGSSDGTDSTSLLVNSAVNSGIVGVVAAGNEGPAKYTIGSPAAADKAITVGDMADVQPGTAASFGCGNAPGWGFYQICFSSRGPTADNRIKPDISSPGVFIMAAAAGTTNGYKELSGTSMSSPFIAGLAGLMLQANSSLTPADIKNKIATTAIDWNGPEADIDYGAGRLDGYEAIKSAGGFTGTNITTPEHKYFPGSLSGTGETDWYDINVTDTSYPIAVTLIMPNWVSSTNPDFDIYLYAADGTTELARSWGTNRQETIGYKPSATGIYKLKVYSYAGSGNYFFDQSAGTAVAVSISLQTDGTTPFGILVLGATKDTTPSGTNDVQTVKVDVGPANLSVKSSNFSDGTGNTWTLGSTNGDNQVKWEFSKEATPSAWTTFEVANNLYPLAANVAQGATQSIYFKLTMPTSTVSSNQYSATVTIVATAP